MPLSRQTKALLTVFVAIITKTAISQKETGDKLIVIGMSLIRINKKYAEHCEHPKIMAFGLYFSY